MRRPSIAKFDNILPNTWHFGLGGEVQVLRSRSPWGVDLALKVDYTRYMHDLGISFKQRALLELGEKLGVSRGVLSGFATVSF